MIPSALGADSVILLVEDDEATALLEKRALVRAGRRVRIVGLVSEALAALREEKFAAILLDYQLPDGDPWPVFEAARRSIPPIPVLLVTAGGDDRIASEVIHRGGADYLVKRDDFWEHLPVAVDRVVKLARVEQSNLRLAALVESSEDGIVVRSLDGEILTWNSGAEQIFGYTAEEVVGRPISILIPPDRLGEEETILERLRQGQSTRQFETLRRRKDGSLVDISVTVSPIYNSEREVVAGADIKRDISERKRVERGLAIRNEITRVAAEATVVEEAAPAFLRVLGGGLGHEMAALWILDPDQETVRCLGFWHKEGTAPGVAARSARPDVRRRRDFPEAAWSDSRAIVHEPAPALASGEAPPGVDLESRAIVPVASRGGVRGVIELLGRPAARPESETAEWLGYIGSQIGQFIEKCQDNEKLRESEQWLRLTLEATKMGVWQLDLASDTATRSLRHDQVYGFTELQSQWGFADFEKVVLPEDLPGAQAAFARAFETGELHIECRVRWPDGTIHWIDSQGVVVRDAAGEAQQMIGVITEATERKAIEEALRKSAEFDRALFAGSPLPMWLYDLQSLAILTVNDAAIRQYGYGRDEFLAMTLDDLRQPGEAGEPEGPPADYHRVGSRWHRKKDGSLIRVEAHVREVTIDGRRLGLALLQDVTVQQKLEEQLRQTQKMDAIGQLAGGIAHDFNNILSVITGYTEVLLERFDRDAYGYRQIAEIHQAGERAAGLTRQLLAFSRQRETEARVVELNEVIGGMREMLQRLIGEDIALVTAPSQVPGRVRADTGQLEQVVMNLAVNARDAMNAGGTLTIETANVDLDENFVRSHVNVRPGPYVRLTVTDTGVGMEPETQARIFEPFFTTKGIGHGTGLGLATVFGIVEQYEGHIYVYSEPGRGSAFKIYLPRVDAPVTPVAEPGTEPRQPGSETLLLVEDEAQLRILIRMVLEEAGYTVLEAAGPRQAVELASDPEVALDLLVTDVIMPEMGGPALAAEIARLRPGLKALFVSGYTGRTLARSGGLDPKAPFLEKPFSRGKLLAKVREVLGNG